MIAAVQLISLLIEALLGTTPSGFLDHLLNALEMLLLFGGLLAYHWQSLQQDGRLRSDILQENAEQITALLFDEEGGTLSSQLASLMDADDSAINIILQNPNEEIPAADAAILPEALAFDPPETLKGWLRGFSGSKFIFKSEADAWFWVDDIQQIKKSLRQLAEGEEISQSKKTPGWMILVYILAGVMSLQILFFLIIIAFEGF